MMMICVVKHRSCVFYDTACREFLIKELKLAKIPFKIAEGNEFDIDVLDDEEIVMIPVEREDENGDKVREFKTYKIIKRLDY